MPACKYSPVLAHEDRRWADVLPTLGCLAPLLPVAGPCVSRMGHREMLHSCRVDNRYIDIWTQPPQLQLQTRRWTPCPLSRDSGDTAMDIIEHESRN